MHSTFSILSNLPTELAWWNVKLLLLLLLLLLSLLFLFIFKRVYAKHQNSPILVLGRFKSHLFFLPPFALSLHDRAFPGAPSPCPQQLRQEMLWLLPSLSRSCFSQCLLQLSLSRPLVQEGRSPGKCQHWVLFALNTPEKSLMLHPTRTG